MSWRTTVMNISSVLKAVGSPALRLRTDAALQVELQAVGRDGTTAHVSTFGVDPDGSPGTYRNARLVKAADGTWAWFAVEPGLWCTSWHHDSDGRSIVVKVVPPPHDITQPLAWGQPVFRVEPDGTVIAKDFIRHEGW